jgi:hypothetical protein
MEARSASGCHTLRFFNVVLMDLWDTGSFRFKSPVAIRLGGHAMKFRLTYDGPLWAAKTDNPRAAHKHDIRKRFHPQLRRLWTLNPSLSTWQEAHPVTGLSGRISGSEALAARFERFGYRFVPLVTEDFSLSCSVDILFVRPDPPGSLVKSGDIDNRLKILFDALRMPTNLNELAGNTAGVDENPFFCLLQDDKLITHLSIDTDMLLEPVCGKSQVEVDDVRLIITVNIRPFVASFGGMTFI